MKGMQRRGPATATRAPGGRGTIVAFATITALALVACSGNEAEESGPDAAAAEAGDETVRPEMVTGQVRQVGSTPFSYTIIDGEDGDVRVLGIYESEISRLSGARIEAVGQATDGGGEGPGTGLRVADYRILSVDGVEPRVGMLLQTPDGRPYLYAEDGETTLLTGVSERLRRSAGAKIWVVTGDEGSVQRFGVIREP